MGVLNVKSDFATPTGVVSSASGRGRFLRGPTAQINDGQVWGGAAGTGGANTSSGASAGGQRGQSKARVKEGQIGRNRARSGCVDNRDGRASSTVNRNPGAIGAGGKGNAIMLIEVNGRETATDSGCLCPGYHGIWVKSRYDRGIARHLFPSACVRRYIGVFDDVRRVTPAAGGQNSNTDPDG